MPTKKRILARPQHILVPMLPALPMVDDGISGSTVDGGGDSSKTRNNSSTSTETDVGVSDAVASSNTTEKKKLGRPLRSKTKNHKKKYKRKTTNSFIDLSDVPHKPPILKNDLSSTGYKDNSRNRPVKNNTSKYTGVYYDKSISKWKAQIMVDKSVRSIGYYDTEEAAAIDYARAAFKYKPFSANSNIYGGLDLSSIPEQQSLITNANSKSGYKGVKKMRDKWQARINLNGKHNNNLGTFDSALEAAVIYARAARYLEERNKMNNEGGEIVEAV